MKTEVKLFEAMVKFEYPETLFHFVKNLQRELSVIL